MISVNDDMTCMIATNATDMPQVMSLRYKNRYGLSVRNRSRRRGHINVTVPTPRVNGTVHAPASRASL